MTEKNPGKKHEAAVDAVLAKLKTFLMAPNHGDGGWPDIPREELDAAAELVREVVDIKWGRDVDDDSPVRVRMWHRGQVRMVCDWAFIDNGPRDESRETADARQERFMRNISTISSVQASCAEELKRVHIEMADVHSRDKRKRAAFEVHYVRYKATPEWDAGEHRKYEPASVHLTEEDAERFIAERAKAGMTVSYHVVKRAVPGYRDSDAEGFAEYRQKVADNCGKLLPDFKLTTELNLQHGRSLKKPATTAAG